MKSANLVKTVILSRHGIRSPKESDAVLRQWSTRAWPTWPGNQGDLTERGKELVKAQWAAMRPFLVENGLIPASGLHQARDYALIADEDQRTRMTAIAMFEGPFSRLPHQATIRQPLRSALSSGQFHVPDNGSPESACRSSGAPRLSG